MELSLSRPPASGRDLCQAIYRGAIMASHHSSASAALLERVRELLTEAYGSAEVLSAFPSPLSGEELFERLGTVRKKLVSDREVNLRLLDVLRSLDLDPELYGCDALRIRYITPDGHTNPKAAAAYYAHRDTWYGNSQSQINFWIPLHDVEASRTFWFFPDRFDAPVENDSAAFDYDRFMEYVGWQGKNQSSEFKPVYPTTRTPLPAEDARGFSLSEGEALLFSGAHLHQTRPNASGKSRLSLDFRVVNLSDHLAGRGAPNVDNESRGDSTKDFPHLPEKFRASLLRTIAA